MPSRSIIPDCVKAAAALVSALFLFGCATPGRLTPQESAVVTGITAGRASVAGERTYMLRAPGGRVYLVSQVLGKPLQEGDSVKLEFAPNGAARIREN